MSGDQARLISFGAFAQVLAIDAADVRAADGGTLHPQQHFAVAGGGHREVFDFHRAVARGRIAPDIAVASIAIQISSESSLDIRRYDYTASDANRDNDEMKVIPLT